MTNASTTGFSISSSSSFQAGAADPRGRGDVLVLALAGTDRVEHGACVRVRGELTGEGAFAGDDDRQPGQHVQLARATDERWTGGRHRLTSPPRLNVSSLEAKL